MVLLVIKFDDLDNTVPADETLHWVHPDNGGVAIRSDLSAPNAKLLREVLQPFYDAGVRIGKQPVRREKTMKAKSGQQRHHKDDGDMPPLEEPEQVDEADEADEEEADAEAPVRSPDASVRPIAEDRTRWWVSVRGESPKRAQARRGYRLLAREWAAENKYVFPPRGALADRIMFAYGHHRKAQGLPVGPRSVGLTS